MAHQSTMRQRLVLSLIIGLLSGLLCYTRLRKEGLVAADFTWAWRGARLLLTGQNPYHDPTLAAGQPYPSDAPLYYPLPALLFALPFSPFPPELAGALFFGLSASLLAFGLTQAAQKGSFQELYGTMKPHLAGRQIEAEVWPSESPALAGAQQLKLLIPMENKLGFRLGNLNLLVFFSASFWLALGWVQWSPLVMAGALLPTLLPAALAKPNLGLPLLLTYPSRKGLFASLILLLLSFAILPTWVQDWLGNLGQNRHSLPLLQFPGPLLLLALLRWRDRKARLLLLLALLPQRLIFYDQLLLWLIPQTKGEHLFLSLLSWLGFFGWLHFSGPTVAFAPPWVVNFFYLPALALIFWQGRAEIRAKLCPSPF